MKKLLLISFSVVSFLFGANDIKCNSLNYVKIKDICYELNSSEIEQIKKLLNIKENYKPTIQKREDTVVSKSLSGEELYQKCAVCHGKNGEKSALGKSKIINEFSASELEKNMNGYLDGSYGYAMKSLMKSQLKDLSKSDIKKLATYIATMKK